MAAYSNLVLHGITQDTVLHYLKSIGRKAFVSPTIGSFVVVYDSTLGTSADWQSIQFINHNKLTFINRLFKRYKDELCTGVIASFTAYFSIVFQCSVMGVFVDDDALWYCCYAKGKFIDEYTSVDDVRDIPWKEQENTDLNLPQIIEGGNAAKLCGAFAIDSPAILQNVETILNKPSGIDSSSDIPTTSDFYYQLEELLAMKSYDSVLRHEALSKALGIHPYWWTVGMSYGDIKQKDLWFYDAVVLDDTKAISIEDVLALLKSTTSGEQ